MTNNEHTTYRNTDGSVCPGGDACDGTCLSPAAYAAREARLEAEAAETYKVVRFHFDAPAETVRTGLTLEEAQAHCQRDETHGTDWFDGYDKE